VSFSREEIHVWQVFSTLLPASDERKSEDSYEIFRSAHAFASSNISYASRYGRPQEARKAEKENAERKQ
jgi:hypothetical protein